jgi:hypothetical protein
VDLYSKRSDVVHARGGESTEDDAFQAMALVKEVVRRLTTDTELLALKSRDELQDWIRRRKYR